MKISFTFENGTSKLTLKPESNRDKALLSLFTNENGKPVLKLGSSIDNDMVIEAEMPKESK